jgi:O-acetyl-ADP-ribose deacetylase (regulator of RNase III)
MPVKIVAGDLFDSGRDVLVNPVNCVGVMGTLSGTFREKFPTYARDYVRKCDLGDINIGAVDIYHTGLTTTVSHIVSFPTMFHPGTPANLSSILLGLEDMRVKLTELTKDDGGWQPIRVGIPALGCGVGGLDFKDVVDLVYMALDHIDGIEVYLFAPPILKFN